MSARRLYRGLEEGALLVAFGLALFLPLVDAVGRPLGGVHVPGAGLYLQQVTLWLTFLGGLLATREKTHPRLTTAQLVDRGPLRDLIQLYSNAAAAGVCWVLAHASSAVVAADRMNGRVLPIGIPEWLGECVMPAALALMGLRFCWRASERNAGRAAALAGSAAATLLPLLPGWGALLFWPLLAAVGAAGLMGAPVFTVMAGVGLLLFFREGTPVSAVSAEIYRLVASPTLPAIPLLTGCGYILAESRSSERLVRCFRGLFGWMPGGVAILVTAVCALFTTFTGGSGVTIIALGGLLYPILRDEGYSERFSLGLITAAGGLGLLFPPSIPVILYGVVANVPADRLYVAGVVPGALLVAVVALYGIREGLRSGVPRVPFSGRAALAGAWDAKWELSVPLVIVGLFASGLASMVEASAAACAYALAIACFVNRDLSVRRDLPRVLTKSGALVGAVLILLASAMGLTSYLIDAQVPDRLLAAVREEIQSPLLFLLVLNAFLLVLGSVLEIYAAIVILTPLVAPAGAAFGLDPVHLGIVFLANLELGFLFPPVGLNLFLSASRFGKPLPHLYRDVLPFLLLLAAGVLLITYLPGLSLGLLRLLP